MEAPVEVAAGEREGEARNEGRVAGEGEAMARPVVAASLSAAVEDDDEGDVCRICRNPADAERPLRYPCACSGSIKYVHQDCLLLWLDHSNARHCEVCKHPFSFSPVYADNAPARLPFQEFLIGMAMKACSVLQFFVRLAFVLSVWLLIIPFITFWIWRLAFVRSLGEAQVLFLSHISTPLILTDCLHGFLLSASIVFIFLGATSLRDYFRHLRELAGHEAERDDDVQERHGARLLRRPPGQANRVNPGEVNGEDAGAPRGIAGAGQIIRRNAENVAAQLEMQAARLEAHVEQMFDGLDDADGAEDVPFDELVGMQGPVFHLVENAITVLASNAIFLGVVIFIPFTFGRMVVYALSWFFSSSSLSSATLSTLSEAALPITNETLKTALTTAKNLSDNEQLSGHIMGAVSESMTNNTGFDVVGNIINASASDLFRTGARSSRISDATTLAVGYMFIFSLVLFYLGLVALVRYSRGEPLTNRRLSGVVSVVEAFSSLFRQFLSGMRHLLTMFKVAFLLVIELGLFPLMCGWWLDICTIKMLGTTMSRRVEFFSISPLSSSLIHWIVGIIYMLQISIFVSLLRGVLRNGVLYFLRDPADPNYNPFRDLIDDPVHKHARRVLLSVAVYGSLIVMLVFVPVKLALQLAPSMFPLDITVSDPFTEIPADMLLFQICIPFAIEHFKPRATIKAILHQWFTVAGWALDLTEFLLPPRGENGGNENENENGDRGRQDGVEQLLLPEAGGRVDDDIVRPPPRIDDEIDDQTDSEYSFVVRIALLLVLAWLTLLVFNSSFIIVPIYLGRLLFNSVPQLPFTHGIKCNDLYAFNIGFYAIWSMVAGSRYVLEYVKRHRTRVLLSQTWKWCAIVLKSSGLLAIWILVIPVLIGLLFELLIIVPMRVPVDESPVFLLYQDWALGLIFLKVWTRLVMMEQMAPLVDEEWRSKLERVREDGFSGLRGVWVLREVVGPIVIKLLTALCVPYVFSRGLFPLLGYPLVVNSAVYRFAWLGCLLFATVAFCTRRFHLWFTSLHNTIRDDRYLIGRRLHDFGDPPPQHQD
ncbi:RING/U-box superfamily protein [Wolffia australiana]